MSRPHAGRVLLLLSFIGGWVALGEAVQPSAEQTPKKALSDPGAELETIAKAWDEAQTEHSQAYDRAKTTEERQKALANRPKFEPYGERCFHLVEAHPRSPAAMRALVFVVWNTRTTPQAARAIELLRPRVAEADLEYLQDHLLWKFPYGMADLAPLVLAKVKGKPEDPSAPTVVAWVCWAAGHGRTKESARLFQEAFEYLVQHHGDSRHPWSVMEYVDLVRWPDDAWVEQQLRAILAVNKTDEVRQRATYTLAAVLAGQSEVKQAEAEKWARECLRISEGMKAKTGEQANGTEVAARHLLLLAVRVGIGKPAPDIVGEDLDGKVFKLSDYRGKVVLLDFWGFW